MPRDIFSAQLGALKDSGYRILRLSELHLWLQGALDLPERSAAITFDDAFADFATEAAPVLRAHACSAAMFAPAAFVGAVSCWAGEAPRPLLSWDQMRSLASDGFEFGSHANRHVDLTQLSPDELADELTASRRKLEAELGASVPYFAAPFGKTNPQVRAAIGAHYDMALGVSLNRAERGCDRFDVPRIEMHYFRDMSRWHGFLAGREEAYFMARKLTRSVRAMRWGA
jgi:peptidoglycan/xylan/chitin deacetylase (PgdA/CDA1 family)